MEPSNLSLSDPLFLVLIHLFLPLSYHHRNKTILPLTSISKAKPHHLLFQLLHIGRFEISFKTWSKNLRTYFVGAFYTYRTLDGKANNLSFALTLAMHKSIGKISIYETVHVVGETRFRNHLLA